MKKLLITGFEPFGAEKINPSWEAVCRLPDKISEYSIHKLLLPVVFREAARMVIEEADKISADVIISVGQAGGRNAITPELVGINLRNAKILDNCGNQPKDETIIVGGADAHFSTLPVRKIADMINESGIPSQVSYSAGTFVCNDVLYTLLAHYKNTEVLVGFIHVPFCSEQGKELSMPLDDIANALIIAIEGID
ncbi:MAG: pyroglutamyl-peptidase I [Clostridia bacterium]|nr:pyroglutamyl-peptidase I [Clostridia bacterium]